MNETEILQRLQEAFRAESLERLTTMGTMLTELESAPDHERKAEILESVFRDAHSLKGAARSVDMADVETICQSMESVFGVLKDRPSVTLTSEMYDTLFKSVEILEAMTSGGDEMNQSSVQEVVGKLEEVNSALVSSAENGADDEDVTCVMADDEEEGEAEAAPSEEPEVRESVEKASSVQTTADSDDAPAIQSPKQETPPKESFFQGVDKGNLIQKVPAKKLTNLFQRSEAMISQKLVSEKHLSELKDLGHAFDMWRRKWSKSARDPLFSEWNADFVLKVAAEVQSLIREADRRHIQIVRLVDDLMDVAREVLMLPCETLLATAPRLVRELAREQGKEVELKISGQDIELDRRILDEMRDPLTHMLRNAVDHGLETAEERKAAGKPGKGRIRITIARVKGDKVQMVLEDDGAGPDLERIRTSALSKGLVTPEELQSLDDHQVAMLMFRSGISSVREVTKVSGRGLGLPIVLERVEKMGGSVKYSGEAGKGSRFTVTLPISIITFLGLLVRVHGQSFIIPGVQISAAIRFSFDQITLTGDQPTILHGDTVLPLVNLGDLLNIPAPSAQEKKEGKFLTAIVVSFGSACVAFQVDEADGMLEVLVKSFGPQIRRIEGLSGAAVLGSGNVVPVLEINDLVKRTTQGALFDSITHQMQVEETEPNSILVVEDSITSRTLLKTILDMEGYNVTTAVDGEEAITFLKKAHYDLVVSDIDMPKVNGFELVEHIRSDDSLADLPVVLVTSLASEEDWRRGMEVGANAYIKKAKFNQIELVDTIGGLL